MSTSSQYQLELAIRPDQYLSAVIILVMTLLIPAQTPSVSQLYTVIQLKPFPQLIQDTQLAIPVDRPNSTYNLILNAKSALAIDLKNPTILYEKMAETEFPHASLTKLMTGLVALDIYQVEDVITITKQDIQSDNSMGLPENEQISVMALLKGLLISSANDAAEALANNHPLGKQGFVKDMNIKAQQLHLNQTRYTNPTGYDEDGHFSTSYDVAMLAKAVLNQPILTQILATKNETVTDTSQLISHPLNSTNFLLFTNPQVIAGKTGTTQQAGECLMTLVNKNNHPILLVLLGSTKRYQDAEQLIAWVYQNYEWVSPLGRDSISADKTIKLQ